MRLNEVLNKELDRLQDSACPHELRFTHEGKRIECRLSALDSLACAFDRITVEDGALDGAGIETLKSVSEALASRLTYLLEPIRTIEVDADQCTVQLRSNPPQRDEDRTSYYELVVQRPGRISLVRYCKETGQPRQPIAAHVTREVLGRLIQDCCQAFQR